MENRFRVWSHQSTKKISLRVINLRCGSDKGIYEAGLHLNDDGVKL